MRFMKVTIAQDELDKKSEGVQNLLSMLFGFVIAFSVTIVSGFWYAWVPRDLNWNASQIVLVMHIAGGAMSLVLFVAFFFLHQKFKAQVWWHILTPWKLRHQPDEMRQHFHQRRLGHIVTWVMLTIYITGILIAAPGVLFLFDHVWMQGYGATQVLRGMHYWVSLMILPILFTHMLWLTRKKG